MSLSDEIDYFDKRKVLPATGETDYWDEIIFPNVIRKREKEILLSRIKEAKPRVVLDLGCGAGWFSRMMSSNGYYVVGIDVSSSLIKSASKSCSATSHFMVGDCMNLPFRDGTFDLIAGVGVLHHLHPDRGLAECHRVTYAGGTLLLMEPNKLNPIAALGRRIAPLSHTKGEKPFAPRELTQALLRKGWLIADTRYLFPFSFALAYVLGRTRWRNNKRLRPICRPIEACDRFFEKVPYLNRLCWTIVVVAKRS